MMVSMPCTSPHWAPEYGMLVWCQDNDDKCIFLDVEPKPCIPDPMRNGLEIIKGRSGFIEY